MPLYPKLTNGAKWENLDKKEKNLGGIGGKVQKNLRKKPKFNKRTGFNNRTGWIFFPKIINARSLISMSGLDFGPKNNKRTLCFYSTVE